MAILLLVLRSYVPFLIPPPPYDFCSLYDFLMYLTRRIRLCGVQMPFIFLLFWCISTRNNNNIDDYFQIFSLHGWRSYAQIIQVGSRPSAQVQQKTLNTTNAFTTKLFAHKVCMSQNVRDYLPQSASNYLEWPGKLLVAVLKDGFKACMLHAHHTYQFWN